MLCFNLIGCTIDWINYILQNKIEYRKVCQNSLSSKEVPGIPEQEKSLLMTIFKVNQYFVL